MLVDRNGFLTIASGGLPTMVGRSADLGAARGRVERLLGNRSITVLGDTIPRRGEEK